MTNSSTRPLKVFLCHASADKPAVRKLYRYLRSKGIDPWLDAEKLLPGENWEIEIPKALFDSDVILVCLSKNSINKEGYVQKEIVFALDKAMEKPDGTIFIVPAKLEDCDVPQRLNRYQWVDLYRDDGRKRLMLSLNKRAAQIGPAVEQAIVADDTLEREKLELEAKKKLARRIAEPENEEREKEKRDTDEKAAREKTEREAVEKVEQEAKEKLTRENETRDALAKASREKTEQEDKEKAEHDTVEKKIIPLRDSASEILNRLPRSKDVKVEPIEIESVPILDGDLKQEKAIAGPVGVTSLSKTQEGKSAPKINLRLLGVILAVLIFVVLGINYAIQNFPVSYAATPTNRPPTITFTPVETATSMFTPTVAITPTTTGPISYIIKEGDTLQAIAEQFNLGPDGVLLILDNNPDIMKQNGVYYVGQTLSIPPAGTVLITATPIPPDLARGTKIEYQVLPGDSLASIAAKFKSTAEDIIILNKLDNANSLQAGQILQIPVNLATATATLPPTSTPSTLGIGSTMTGKDDMTLLYVPAGEFTMGRYAEDAFAECQKLSSNCKLSDYVDEEPPHKVLLDSYWMDQTEVTNDMFAKFLNERGNQIEEGVNWLNTDDLNTHIYQAGNVWEVDKGYEKHPVIDITWYGANSYCSWVDRRLPTEAEWEKAARGEDGRTYPWGNEFDCKLANFDDETTLDMNVVYGGKNCDGFPRSSPVGSFIHGVSPYGILDMAGNVWEWVSSLYKPYPYSSIDGREDTSSKEARVLRGGSWVNYDDGLRSSDRYAVFHRNSSYIYGFRCATRAIP